MNEGKGTLKNDSEYRKQNRYTGLLQRLVL